MKRRTVLYIAKTARGGSAFSLYHLVTGLDRTAFEPIVLFYTQENPHIGDKLAQSGIKTITLKEASTSPSVKALRPVRRRDIADWLESHLGKTIAQFYLFLKALYTFMRREMGMIWPIINVIREHQIDLVHVNTGLRHGKPAIIASRLVRTPCVCHVRMLDELIYFDKLFTRFADTFIFISGAVRDNYVHQVGYSIPGTVVHNAINLDDFSTDVDVSAVRNEFGWNRQESVVGVVGRLDWWKGHDDFLEAMAEVIQWMPDVKGLIVGAPENSPLNLEYHQKLQVVTKSLGLEDKVIFTGFRKDIPRLMAAMDVVVLSSSSPEPFGRVVIEGMAAGKPVVATAAGGVLDIVENGVNGLLVPPKDSKAMAAAILRLLSDPQKARQMGQAARRRVKEEFTVQSHVAAIQQVYNLMLGAQEDHQATTEHHTISGVASGRSLPDKESGGFEGERHAHTETC